MKKPCIYKDYRGFPVNTRLYEKVRKMGLEPIDNRPFKPRTPIRVIHRVILIKKEGRIMVSEIRDDIISELSGTFDSEQLRAIDLAVAKALQGYDVVEAETLPAAVINIRPLTVREFIARKRVKGCSEGTIKRYEYCLDMFLAWAQKDLSEMTDIDILVYLDYIKSTHKMSNRTLDGHRLVLSSFYTFLQESGKISVNPMRSIDPIKFKGKVREPLSDMEMEQVRYACKTERERAMVEVLYSTGGRLSEVISMDWSDIDFENRRMVITGKGDKERYVFFNAKSIFAIQKYLATRTDDNPALFVTDHAPHERITKSGFQWVIRELGKRSGIDRPLYPHLFRHTFATDMLSHGAPIDEVSKMLGHEKLETTMIYTKVATESLAYSHKRYIA